MTTPLMTTTSNYDLMLIDEVSAYTRIPESTLRWYRHKGTGPKVAKIGGRLMYRRSDVEAWITAAFEEGDDE